MRPPSNLNGIYSNFGAVAGPALGGVLIAAIGLAADVRRRRRDVPASLAAVFALPRIPASPDADRPGLRSVVQGFRYLRNQRVVLGSFLVDANAMVFGMPSALFPALAEERFGGGAQTVGTSMPRRMRVRWSARSSPAGRGTCAGRGSPC